MTNIGAVTQQKLCNIFVNIAFSELCKVCFCGEIFQRILCCLFSVLVYRFIFIPKFKPVLTPTVNICEAIVNTITAVYVYLQTSFVLQKHTFSSLIILAMFYVVFARIQDAVMKERP